MHSVFPVSVVALAVLAGASVASAQTTTIIERPAVVELSPTERTVIRRHVLRERVVVQRPSVELRVGAPVPSSVELYEFPEEVYVDVPEVRRYRYVQFEDEIALVDPETSEIIEIIRD